MLDLSGRVDGVILRWLSHVEQKPNWRITKALCLSEVEGTRHWGRSRTESFNESMERALECRVLDMTIERARGMVGDRDSWREFLRL